MRAVRGILLLGPQVIITVRLRVPIEEEPTRPADMARQAVLPVATDQPGMALLDRTPIAVAEGRRLPALKPLLRLILPNGPERRDLFKHDGLTRISSF